MMPTCELLEFDRLMELGAQGLTLDSRDIKKGDLFVALKGQCADGHDFINDAIAAGAIAVLAEHSVGAKPVPVIVVKELAQKISELAHRFYGCPSRQLSVIGVTGTNGKTSCCQYIAQTLDFLGKRCGLIGTNGQGLWGDVSETFNTTPDAIRVQRELSRQLKAGGQFCAMEVSSHGLVQHRVESIEFRTAIFTNLSHDHLDYHGTMAAYGEAKWQLFKWPTLQNAIINLDDDWARNHLQSVSAQQVLTYGWSQEADIRVLDCRCHPAGMDASVTTPWGDAELNLQIIGRFNLSNALAAFAVLLSEHIPIATAARVISIVRSVKGRMERLLLSGGPTVVVDYAHTPDALAKALSACREHVSGRLGVIFGCGGDRDKGKRAQMASAAETGADFIVVTEDNSRFEAAEDIFADIRSGFAQPDKVLEIPNRRDAIINTLNACQPTDVLLIAGKGHETYQERQGIRHLFSDQDTVLSWQDSLC